MHLKRRLRISEKDLVVEIGGGANPHFRSDVLLDKFLGDSEHAWQRGDAELIVDRPFIHYDGLHTPFQDKQCDYVMLSHVIEHIPPKDIDAFMAELNRIGKAGYIEAPSVLFEHMAEIPAHNWFVYCSADCIYLAPRNMTPYKRLLKPLLNSLGLLIEDLSEIFFTGIEWEGMIKYQVCTNVETILDMIEEDTFDILAQQSLREAKEVHLDKQRERLLHFFDFSRMLRGALKRVKLIPPEPVQRRQPPFDWKEECVCSKCHEHFMVKEDSIICSCGATYQVLTANIPSFG